MSRQHDPDNTSLFQNELYREFMIAGRFGVVGCIATFIHMLIVWILIERLSVQAFNANFVAFFLAFCFSFSGNYYWTFSKPGNKGRVLRRFFIISASAFAANTLLLAVLLSNAWLSPLASTLSATVVIPLISFLASRFWGFKPQENECI